MMSDLRAELGARPDPEFDLELPTGWARRTPDEVTQKQMLADLKARLMQAQRPEMFAQTKSMLEGSFESMRRHGVFAFFAPVDEVPGAMFLAASLNASIRVASAGGTLDGDVRTMIRDHGATALLGNKQTIRMEREKQVKVGTDTLINHSVLYLTPVPGSGRRRALQLVAGFGRAPQTPSDDDALQATRFLFDTCVASLRWRPATTA